MPATVLSKFLLLGAVICLVSAGVLIATRYVPVNLSFSRPPAQQIPPGAILPQTISLPDLSLVLPVVPGLIDRNRWPLSSDGVVYIASTPVPGQAGNSVLYGHNWPRLLGRLHTSRVGQSIFISYSDHSQKKFSITDIQTVGPNAFQILSDFGDTRITLYTCTGFLDLQRLVVIAKPV